MANISKEKRERLIDTINFIKEYAYKNGNEDLRNKVLIGTLNNPENCKLRDTRIAN